MEKISQLPTAATSFYSIKPYGRLSPRSGQRWAMVLVTPAGRKPIVTKLAVFGDRESAIAAASIRAEMAMRPFKDKIG